MKVSEIMSVPAIPIHPEETAAVAARTLEHYNIGALPVCDTRGKLCGMVTDRDLALRCLAAGHTAEQTRIREVMTRQVVYVTPDMNAKDAAQIMARNQIRRLPVLENGALCGMVSLGDLAARGQEEDALQQISKPLSSR